MTRRSGGLVMTACGLAVSFVIGGCTPEGPADGDAEPQTESGGANGPVETADAPPVELKVVSGRAEYDAVIESHQGKAVLVDFWATWCVPCVQNVPRTVELHREHSEDGLAVVSVSMDEPRINADLEEETTEQLQARVREILTEHEARFTNLLVRPQEGQDAYAELEIKGGQLPHFKLYGRDGELIQAFGGDGQPVDHAEVEAAVEAALVR
ncbi:MAG: thioredoxin domain-containing protein [Planctomycetaceae bacterium]